MKRYLVVLLLLIFALLTFTNCGGPALFEQPTTDPTPVSNNDYMLIEVQYPDLSKEVVPVNSMVDLDSKVRAKDRLTAVAFTLTNTTSNPIVFAGLSNIKFDTATGDPGEFKIVRIDSDPAGGLMPADFAFRFSVRYQPTVYDNSLKECKVVIAYNTSSAFSFSIDVTSKLSNKIEFKTASVASYSWNVTTEASYPEFSATITVVGGGGAGASGGGDYYYDSGCQCNRDYSGGGGGGAGQLKQIVGVRFAIGTTSTIIVGFGGIYGLANGSPSGISYYNAAGAQSISCLAGLNGSKATDYSGVVGGSGYPGGEAGSIEKGGNGGNDGRGYGVGGIYGNGGCGMNAPENSGGGGGGGLGGIYNLSGGNGGSGYVGIEWTAFVKP
jgi:hypothetical protein